MKREAIATGETVMQAKEEACRKLGINEEDAEFEILQMPAKKKFGLFGGSDAKVKVFINTDTEEPTKEQTVKTDTLKVEKSKKATSKPVSHNEEEISYKTEACENAKKISRDYLEKIITLMGVEDFTITEKDIDHGVHYDIESSNAGLIIGKKGETLDCIQYLVSLVTNNIGGLTYFRININVGNYREKREQTLNSLAEKMAQKAKKFKKRVYLDPMNPYDRRIVHTAVQKVEGITSWSEGEGMNRHVIISPDDIKQGNSHSSYNNKRKHNSPKVTKNASQVGTYGKIVSGEKRTTSLPEMSFPEAEMKNEAPVSPLYGKIEPRN